MSLSYRTTLRVLICWKRSKTVLTPVVTVSWVINFIAECKSSPLESKRKFFQNLRKGEVWSIYVEREKPIFLFFSPQFKIVGNIDKTALDDEQPITWHTDVAEAEYMVASKKQEGGKDQSFQKDLSISKKSECWGWFQSSCPLWINSDCFLKSEIKMRIQYESTSKMLDLFYNFICCIFSITKLH